MHFMTGIGTGFIYSSDFFLVDLWYLEELEDLWDNDIALGPHFEVKACLMMVFNRNRS